MALYNNEAHLFRQDLENYFRRVEGGDPRRQAFCRELLYASELQNDVIDRIFIQMMNCKSLFPNDEDKYYFFKFALENSNLKAIKLLEASNLNVHEHTFNDGMYALHYLAKVVYGMEKSVLRSIADTLEVMEYFLKNAHENYCDDQGYTYFHAACMAGNLTAVNLFLSQGVDANLDSYTCSPLHIAAQYRWENIVESLLKHDADPNARDHEQSTPLHALARVCLCACTSGLNSCDNRKPVDKIVEMLIRYDAKIEARNCHGDTALQMSVSCFDLDLAQALVKFGAKLNSLNENKIFNRNFTPAELENYPLPLNIVEIKQFLRSNGYEINLHMKLRMIKCLMRVRGSDTDYLIPAVTRIEQNKEATFFVMVIIGYLSIYDKFGIYMKQEVMDFLRQQCEQCEQNPTYGVDWPEVHRLAQDISSSDAVTAGIASIEKIKLTENVSLYQICQMSYKKGCSILKGVYNIPQRHNLLHNVFNMTVKRHIGNVLMRRELELFVADLFMTDYCKLNLPDVVCRNITEHMDDEDLLRLCEKTTEDCLPLPFPIRRSERLRAGNA